MIIFVKNPVLGKAKTRLAQSIGDEAALEVYRYLLNYTFQISYRLPVDKAVYYAQHLGVNDVWSPAYYHQEVQQGASLGERMTQAFQKAFERGFRRVLILGSDCLELKTHHLEEAFLKLQAYNFVIGPAKDGGYYLLGMNYFEDSIFENKNWSTDSVLQDTLKDIESLGASYYLLPTLSDIDHVEDLEGFEAN